VLVVNCGDDSTVPVVNLPPTITFDQEAIAFKRVAVHELSVTISDPDEDAVLTTTWSITGTGSLTPIGGSQTRRSWQAPAVTGPDTLTVTVSDGELTDTIEEIIWSGTTLNTVSGVLDIPGSPYIIESAGSPTVSVGGTATIEAGVEVLIDVPDGTLSVASGATLLVQGTEADSVVIRPNRRNLRCQNQRGWWTGIEVSAGGNLNFDYAEITYGKRNITLVQTGNATISNTSLKCAEEAAVLMASTGSLTMRGCEVSNNADVGVNIASLTAVPTSVQIIDCHILINGNTGVRMDLRDALKQANINLRGNRIEFNFTHGVYLTHQSFPVIRVNHFAANGLSGGLSNIRLQRPYPDGVTFPILLADSNYWGGTINNRSEIDATIHDSLDDATIGTRIETVPWLNTSPAP